MKRAALTFGLLVTGVISAFWFFEARAAVLISNEDFSEQCRSNGTWARCDLGGQSTDTLLRQAVYLPLIETATSTYIGGFSFNLDGYSGAPAAGEYWRGILRDGDLNILATSASSTPTAATGWHTFTFQNAYHVTSTSAIPEFIEIERKYDTFGARFSATNMWYGTPYYGTFASTSQGGLAGLFPATTSGGVATTTQQFAFRVYDAAGTDSVTIDTPEFNVVQMPIVFGGECSGTVELFLSYGDINYTQNYVDFTISGISCSSGRWSYDPGTLYVGHWDARATVGFATATRGIDIIQGTLWTNPFTGTSTATDTEPWYSFGGLKNTLLQIRPWAYIPQIVGSLFTAFDNATTTGWTEGFQFNTSIGTQTVGAIDANIVQQSASQFNVFTGIVRPLSTMAFFFGFIWVVWALKDQVL